MSTSPHGIKASAHRPVIMGTRGAVASGHWLASQAGIRVLQAGGNAVDAAVAVGATLNMVEPNMSGVGGDGFIMVYMNPHPQPLSHGERGANPASPLSRNAGEGSGVRVAVCNGTGAAPLRSNAAMFRKVGIPYKGILSVSTPGIGDAWLLAHEKYGGLPLDEVFAPAIEICEEGFPVSHKLAAALANETPPFASIPYSCDVFCREGRPLRAGEVCRNPHLGRTFRALAREGRDALYQGEIARAIVKFSNAAGGLLTMEDFERHRGFWQEPISTTYRDHTVYEAPPNSSGHVLLQELNLIEHFDIPALGYNTAESVHVMAEAKRLAFADREAFLADPEFTDIPLAGLLSKEYSAERAILIDPKRAAKSVAPGTPGPFQSSILNPRSSIRPEDTTCFVVVDRWGNAVCQLQSIQSGFGSGLIAGETGILLNNRMTYWHLEEGHPDCLMPGKRVRHTMNPVMVFDPEGRLSLVLGTPGADTQVQTNLQVISHVLDFGLTPQEAIESPRWRHVGIGTESEFPHGDENELRLEARFAPKTVEGLRVKGHPVVVIGEWEAMGSEMIIQVEAECGTLCAGADARRDGYAVAW